MSLSRFLADEAATLAFGKSLAQSLEPGLLIFLQGDLGAGKTTLVRGILRGLGYAGSVKSPTYTLVEEYPLTDFPLYHFDLYRLGDPEELEFMGIRDFLDPGAVVLVEWPERGQGILPPADLIIAIDHRDTGRELTLAAQSESGRRLLQKET